MFQRVPSLISLQQLLELTYALSQMFQMFQKIIFYFLFQREISKMRQLIGVKFCTLITTRPSFIMPVQNFLGAHPKNILGPKTCKI